MLTVDNTVPNPTLEPALHELAHQAASNAKLTADPAQAFRLTAMFSKDFPANTHLANFCDSRLVNQMTFLMEIPNGPATLAVLSCPFPTANGAEEVFAGSLGDAMDLICPVTFVEWL